MASFKPWMTSNGLIESIKRKISFPISQNTFSKADLLSFANEENMISQVPAVMTYHEEYFVFKVATPLLPNVSRYAIPDRAIGMKMRDLFMMDSSGNLSEMTRISSEDKAYWQSNYSSSDGLTKFYIEGNDVVLPNVSSNPNGSLVFYIYLRPNQLVDDARACIIQSFVKSIAVSNVGGGHTITITLPTGTSKDFVAGNDFSIGQSDAETASNLSNAISQSGIASATAVVNMVSVFYSQLGTTITSSNSIPLAVQDSQGINFDQVPSDYTDPDTNVTTQLYYGGAMIDFLQTKPGHRTYGYDVQIPMTGIQGNIINFNADDVPDNMVVGDYICLSNECIIPQIPPDLHNSLAERTCARILAAIGDQAGMQASMQKIQEMDARTGTLLDNRAEGAPQKISGRRGLLRYGKRGY